MYWAHTIHLYQPPTQRPEALRRLVEECYRPLVALLRRHHQARLTVNIAGSLTELLAEHGYRDVLDGWRALGETGQVEFTASAMYHPILPLIPRHQVTRQVQLNTEINRRYLGEAYQPRGLFPPELAYNFEVTEVAAAQGYRWLLLDEVACPHPLSRATTFRHRDMPSLGLLFRERALSENISRGRISTADAFLSALGEAVAAEGYLVTVTGDDVNGQHGLSRQVRLLEDLYQRQALPTCTLSELLDRFPEGELVTPQDSSWVSQQDELEEGVPYAQWNYPGHAAHDLQWRLVQLALYAVVTACPDIRRYPRAQQLLDQGLHSGQFQWASCRPWWNRNVALQGTRLLLEAIHALDDGVSVETIILAESLYEELEVICAEWEAQGFPNRLAQEYLARYPGEGQPHGLGTTVEGV